MESDFDDFDWSDEAVGAQEPTKEVADSALQRAGAAAQAVIGDMSDFDDFDGLSDFDDLDEESPPAVAETQVKATPDESDFDDFDDVSDANSPASPAPAAVVASDSLSDFDDFDDMDEPDTPAAAAVDPSPEAAQAAQAPKAAAQQQQQPKQQQPKQEPKQQQPKQQQPKQQQQAQQLQANTGAKEEEDTPIPQTSSEEQKSHYESSVRTEMPTTDNSVKAARRVAPIDSARLDHVDPDLLDKCRSVIDACVEPAMQIGDAASHTIEVVNTLNAMICALEREEEEAELAVFRREQELADSALQQGLEDMRQLLASSALAKPAFEPPVSTKPPRTKNASTSGARKRASPAPHRTPISRSKQRAREQRPAAPPSQARSTSVKPKTRTGTRTKARSMRPTPRQASPRARPRPHSTAIATRDQVPPIRSPKLSHPRRPTSARVREGAREGALFPSSGPTLSHMGDRFRAGMQTLANLDAALARLQPVQTLASGSKARSRRQRPHSSASSAKRRPRNVAPRANVQRTPISGVQSSGRRAQRAKRSSKSQRQRKQPQEFAPASTSAPSWPQQTAQGGEVLFVCSNGQYRCSHAILRHCLIHDGSTKRYVCPEVSVQTMEQVVQVLRVYHSQNRLSISKVPGSSIPSMLQAANVLQVPELLVLCLAQVYAERGCDRRLLQQIIPESFMASLHPSESVRFTDALLSCVPGGITQDIGDVLEQHWHTQVLAQFPDTYQAHLAFRKRTTSGKAEWSVVFAELCARRAMLQRAAGLPEDAGLWMKPGFGALVQAVDASYTEANSASIDFMARRCPRLSSLDLNETALMDRDLQPLLSLTQLSWLGVGSARVSANFISAMRRNNPRLVVQ